MTPQRSPYPGLRPFNRDESDLFYGRDRCISAMVETLQETRFLAVLGPSGSGKSSLVRSGLFLDLEAGRARKAGARWTFLDIRHPRQQPYRELARELLRYECEMREGVHDALPAEGGACNAPLFNPPDHVLAERRRQLRKDPLALARWWKENRPDERTNLLLLVDQFEELFGYGEAKERNDVEAFVDMLLKCRASNDPAVYVVLTMRSEFLAGCTLFAGLSEQINKSLSLTPRMTREECRQAITGPAAMAEVTLEPLLVTTLLNDMNSLAQWQEEAGGEAPDDGAAAAAPEGFKQTDLIARRADQLPLMQHVLNWMWLGAAARRGSPDEPIVLKLDDYLAIGGLTGALSRHAGEVMARTGDPEATERVFRALTSQPTVVSLGSAESSGVRRPRTIDQLVAETGVGEERVRAVVEAFRGDGVSMLTPSTEIALTNDLEVDIAHESLIRQWSELRRWIREEAENGRAWQELIRDTEQEGSKRAELLRGLELSDRRRWWATTKPHAGWADRYEGKFEAVDAFMARSVAGERRRRAVRYGGTGLLGILATAGLTIFAYSSAATAEARAAADQASMKAMLAAEKAASADQKAAEAEAKRAAAGALAADAEKKAAGAAEREREAIASASRAAVEQRRASEASRAAQTAAQSAQQAARTAAARLQQTEDQSTRLTAAAQNLSQTFILPLLRRASSSTDAVSAGQMVRQITAMSKPLENANPAAFVEATMELRLEEAEIAANDLDVGKLQEVRQAFADDAANDVIDGPVRSLNRLHALTVQGRTELVTGQPEAALETFRQAVEHGASMDPSMLGNWPLLARAAASSGMAQAAIEASWKSTDPLRAAQLLAVAREQSSSCLAALPPSAAKEEAPSAEGNQEEDRLDSINRAENFEARLTLTQCRLAQALAVTDPGERGKLLEQALRSLQEAGSERWGADLEPSRLLLLSHYVRAKADDPVRKGLEFLPGSANLFLMTLGDRENTDSSSIKFDDVELPSYAHFAVAEAESLLLEYLRSASRISTFEDGVFSAWLLNMISQRLNRVFAATDGSERPNPGPAARLNPLLNGIVAEYVALGRAWPERRTPILNVLEVPLGIATSPNIAALDDGAVRRALLEKSTQIIEQFTARARYAPYGFLRNYAQTVENAYKRLCPAGSSASDEDCGKLKGAQESLIAESREVEESFGALTRQAAAAKSTFSTWEEDEVALGGYDPVSCSEHTSGSRLEGEGILGATETCELNVGRYSNAVVWDGSVWLFATEATKQEFLKRPECWVPQFSGYNSQALAAEDQAAAKPIRGDILSILVDGRRYLMAMESQEEESAGSSGSEPGADQDLSVFDVEEPPPSASMDDMMGNMMTGGNMVMGNNSMGAYVRFSAETLDLAKSFWRRLSGSAGIKAPKQCNTEHSASTPR